jgi:hypothetical protein
LRLTRVGNISIVDDTTEPRDLDRVASRAKSLAHEESELDIADTGEQAAAILAESDARAEDPDTMEHQSGDHERRTSEETVDPT